MTATMTDAARIRAVLDRVRTGEWPNPADLQVAEAIREVDADPRDPRPRPLTFEQWVAVHRDVAACSARFGHDVTPRHYAEHVALAGVVGRGRPRGD